MIVLDKLKGHLSMTDNAIDLRTLVEQALADVWAVDITDVQRRQKASPGPLEVDSHVAEAVLGKVEGTLGVEIPGVDELDPQDIATIEQLIALAGTAPTRTDA